VKVSRVCAARSSSSTPMADFLKILGLLHDNHVDFVIVGGVGL
jgi:hypothetical protein